MLLRLPLPPQLLQLRNQNVAGTHRQRCHGPHGRGQALPIEVGAAPPNLNLILSHDGAGVVGKPAAGGRVCVSVAG